MALMITDVPPAMHVLTLVLTRPSQKATLSIRLMHYAVRSVSVPKTSHNVCLNARPIVSFPIQIGRKLKSNYRPSTNHCTSR